MKIFFKFFIFLIIFVNSANAKDIIITDKVVSAKYSNSRNFVYLYFDLYFSLNKNFNAIGACVEIYDSQNNRIYFSALPYSPYSSGNYAIKGDRTIAASDWDRGKKVRFFIGEKVCWADIKSNFVEFYPQKLITN